MIWILGGTSEAREIANRIQDLDNYIITIATEEGKEFISSDNIMVGRLSYDEMIGFAEEHKINLIVDLTHPFAKVVTENAEKLSKEMDIKYIRYTREKISNLEKVIYLDSYEEAYNYLKNIEGTVFFTTGSKNIYDFEKVKGKNRFIYRIIPATDSLAICKENNILMKDIIAVLGPFSSSYNEIMFREYAADYVIMKDSGDKGGTLEKIYACKSLGIVPIVIGRNDEQGINDLDLIEKIIRGES